MRVNSEPFSKQIPDAILNAKHDSSVICRNGAQIIAMRCTRNNVRRRTGVQIPLDAHRAPRIDQSVGEVDILHLRVPSTEIDVFPGNALVNGFVRQRIVVQIGAKLCIEFDWETGAKRLMDRAGRLIPSEFSAGLVQPLSASRLNGQRPLAGIPVDLDRLDIVVQTIVVLNANNVSEVSGESFKGCLIASGSKIIARISNCCVSIIISNSKRMDLEIT